MQTPSNPLATASGAYCDLDSLLRLRAFAGALRLNQPRSVRSQLSGPRRSNVRGRGIEFEEVRNYTPGDDVRSIDWRVTARTGKVHTKLFHEERERPVYLLVDQRAAMFFGSRQTLKSVQAVYAAALLAWATLDEGDRIGGLVFGTATHHEIRPRRSHRAVIELLRRCHELNQRLGIPSSAATSQAMDLAAALSTVRRVARPGSLVVVLSDFHDWGGESERQLHLLARHCEIAAVWVYDRLEERLPAHGRGMVSDGQRRDYLDTGNARLRQLHEARFLSAHDALTSSLGRIGAPLIRLATEEAALDVLGRCYRRRKHE